VRACVHKGVSQKKCLYNVTGSKIRTTSNLTIVYEFLMFDSVKLLERFCKSLTTHKASNYSLRTYLD
jgi:hypothetical protein